MGSSKGIGAIVDAFVTPALQLQKTLKARGYSCVHVQSGESFPSWATKSFRQNDFIGSIVHYGNIETTLQALHKYGVTFVLPGNESAVELCDRLSEGLGLLTNGTRMTPARRDKFLMIEAVKNAGLRTIATIKAKSPDTIIDWARENRFRRIVVKPKNSGGTDGVSLCRTEEDIVQAFYAIYQHQNIFGFTNNEVLAQEFIDGTEYVVNFVSYQGRRVLTDLIRYTKRLTQDGNILYEADERINRRGPLEQQLIDYTTKVLDALDIQNGPTHAEVFMTPEGPILTEVASRLDGCTDIALSRALEAPNQIELTADAYTNPEAFLSHVGTELPESKEMMMLYFISITEGLVTAMPKVARIRELPSYFDMNLKVELGSTLKKTCDYVTCPGYVMLVHDDLKVVEKDYATIRQWEHEGLFQVVSLEAESAETDRLANVSNA